MNSNTNEKKKNWIKCTVLLFVCIFLLYFIIKYNSSANRLYHSLKKYKHKSIKMNIEYLKGFILSYGSFAEIIYVLIYMLKPLLLIVPISLVSIVGGVVFGPIKATFLSMIGCFLGATLAFFLGRALGKPFVDKLLRGKAVKLDDDIEKYGLGIMFVMRASFIFPYDPLSYAAGLTKMKYKGFIIGTLLGVFPEMIAYSYMGKNIHKPLSITFFLPLIAVLIIALITSQIYKAYKKKNQS